MSGKLDQALDDIVKTNRSQRRRVHRVKRTKTTATTAPTGGIQKPSKSVKQTKTVAGPSSGPRESKIQPPDVTEAQIKEYFGKTIGPIKKVLVTYNKNGQSVGVATIIFREREAASQAAKQLNGTRVDNRPMRIEVLMDAKSAPEPTAPKSLADRVVYDSKRRPDLSLPLTKASANPKAQPKSAVADKNATKNKDGKRVGRAKRGRNAGRPKRKTAEELDAEMMDYFGGTNGDANAGTADAAATNGNANAGGDAMDEISVSSPHFIF
ncbi:MAG: hypothetical protein Q9227_007674 [Pyrenula ochraceoflavens]